MGGRTWTRLAAATGIDFVAVGAALAILSELEEFDHIGEFALRSSDEMWATATLLIGFAAIFLLWFTATAAARLRQLEWSFGGSGRLAATFFASGAVVAGLIALEAGLQFAVRQGGGAESVVSLTNSLVEGPTLAFPIAAYIVSAATVGYRSSGLPVYSRLLVLLSFPTGLWFAASAGIQLFKNYAWLDETAYFVFLGWVLMLSVIGVIRWVDLDVTAPARRGRAAAAPTEVIEPITAPVRVQRATARTRTRARARRRAPSGPPPEAPAAERRARKPRARKAAPRKRQTRRPETAEAPQTPEAP